MPNSNLIPAIIIAGAIIVAGFLIGGRYSLVGGNSGAGLRLDRLTGSVVFCNTSGCSN